MTIMIFISDAEMGQVVLRRGVYVETVQQNVFSLTVPEITLQ